MDEERMIYRMAQSHGTEKKLKIETRSQFISIRTRLEIILFQGIPL
jgi:hypothetical protein